jgi:hypothetical protein
VSWKAVRWLFAAAITLAVLAPQPASAHAGDQSYLYLDIVPDDLSGRIELPFPDIEDAIGVPMSGSEDEVTAAVDANLDRILDYVDDHFDIGALGATWTTTFSDYGYLIDEFDGRTNYLILPFDVDLAAGSVPQILDIRFDPFVGEIDGREALLLIGNDYERGVFDNEADHLVVFDAGSRSQQVDLGEGGWWPNFSASVELGLDHIRTGPDHIFFVVVLLLPSVLIFSMRGWRPVDKFGSSLWRVLKLVTTFTIAHSITFTLAGLDVLPLPSSKVVESIIALSIAAAALNNIWPIAPNKEWMIAGAFGLFHGMGFASLVAGLDVDRSTQLISLLGRNVGIEIGQSIVVLITFPALFLLRRTIYYRALFLVSSAVLALLATGWMFERMFVRDLGYNGLVSRVLEFPRSLVAMAVVTVIAAVIWRFEARSGRLLPVGEDELSERDAEREPVPV